MKTPKTKQTVKPPDPKYIPRPLHWLVLKGLRRLMPTPYVYVIPDLKIFKKMK